MLGHSWPCIWHTERMIRVLIALSLAVSPVAAQKAPDVKSMIKPTSSVHVSIKNAWVNELDCSGRGTAFETTSHSARHFPYMSRTTFSGDVDPRQMLVGIFSMILLVPITVISVPIDLVAMPFRRECDFNLTIEGQLQEWAGRTAQNKPVGILGNNLLRKGIQGVSVPKIFKASGKAMSNDKGIFTISVDGHVGSSKEYHLRFSVNDLVANSLVLRKTGKVFLLEEQDPGFGTGVHENESREIQPEMKKKKKKD